MLFGTLLIFIYISREANDPWQPRMVVYMLKSRCMSCGDKLDHRLRGSVEVVK